VPARGTPAGEREALRPAGSRSELEADSEAENEGFEVLDGLPVVVAGQLVFLAEGGVGIEHVEHVHRKGDLEYNYYDICNIYYIYVALDLYFWGGGLPQFS